MACPFQAGQQEWVLCQFPCHFDQHRIAARQVLRRLFVGQGIVKVNFSRR
jgi:hypothetical protein